MFDRWSVVILLLLIWLAGPAAGAHPQDGPHADIRIVITDRDVRMTVGMNLPFLDAAAETGRESQSVVDPSEEGVVLDAVRRLFAEDTRFVIDGVEVTPVVEQATIERLSEDSLYLFPNSGRAALTRFSVVAVYPCESQPESVLIRWSHFPPSALSNAFEVVGDEPPPMVVEAQLKAEGRVRIIRLSESEPTFLWTAGGDTPETAVESLPQIDVDRGVGIPLALIAALAGFGAIAAGLGITGRRQVALAVALLGLAVGVAVRDMGVRRVGRPVVPEDQALRLFAILHSNIYRAFDFTTEDEIYDTLAISVTGDLLDSLYRQIRLGLVQAENGGGVGRVTSLELTDAQLLTVASQPQGVAFEVYAEWTVEGTVYHFGHSHAKRTPYAGLFRVTETPGGWRIDNADPQPRGSLLESPSEL